MIRDRLGIGNIYRIKTNNYTEAVGYLCTNGETGEKQTMYFSVGSKKGCFNISVYETKEYEDITNKI